MEITSEKLEKKEQKGTVEEGNWDIVISPKTSLFDLRLKEVWRYRDLMWLFVKRDFVAKYKQTVLGPLWHVIQPVLTTLMFLFIFGRVAKLSTDGIQPPFLFYLSGITIWNYFSFCLNNTSATFVTNASIFGKVYFPRLVLPISIVISNIVQLAIQMTLLAIAMLYCHFTGYEQHVGWQLLLIPLLVFQLAGLGMGLGIIVSSLTTKYRDFAVLLTFILQLGMYATPVAYPLSFLSGTKYGWILQLNPVAPLVEAFRYILFGTGTFTIFTLSYSFIFMVFVLFLGTVMFNKVEKRFMDTV